MTWSQCGDAREQVCPTDGVKVAPDPPTPGTDFRVSITCLAKEETMQGEAKLEIFVGPIKFDTESEDYCKLIPCPARKGLRTTTVQHEIPKIAPHGTPITLHSEIHGVDKLGHDEVISCTVIHFNIGDEAAGSKDGNWTSLPRKTADVNRTQA